MPFSKFDPHRPQGPGDALEATDESAARRARFLKWATWVVQAFTLVGFGFLAYWIFRSG